jgi:hypothetical protein
MEGKGILMTRARCLPAILGFFLLAGPLIAADQPLYNEKADARQQIASALAEASKHGKNVVLIFGANW